MSVVLAVMPSGEDTDEQISISLTLNIEFETLIHYMRNASSFFLLEDQNQSLSVQRELKYEPRGFLSRSIQRDFPWDWVKGPRRKNPSWCFQVLSPASNSRDAALVKRQVQQKALGSMLSLPHILFLHAIHQLLFRCESFSPKNRTRTRFLCRFPKDYGETNT